MLLYLSNVDFEWIGRGVVVVFLFAIALGLCYGVSAGIKKAYRNYKNRVNHDTSRIPLARSRRNNGNSTMQLIVDEMGLAVKVQLDTENNSEARALYSAVQRGDILRGLYTTCGKNITGEKNEKQRIDYQVPQ